MLPGVIVGAELTSSDQVLNQLVADRVASRLFEQDPTLWGDDAEAEARIRLGWVNAWEQSEVLIDQVQDLRRELHSSGVDRVVLCGMGGSSLGPEVIARHNGVDLTVLDSTHPAQVRRALSDLPRTVVVVSSKSGSTVETRSQLSAFETAFAEDGISAAERIVVVTDPGSPLEKYGQDRGYRVFLADPHVGGRYSALTAFGLVPSVLAGADFGALLADARATAASVRTDSPENPALRLASALAKELPERYVACVSEPAGDPTGLPEWIEQLIAESTGKHGRGLLPVALAAGAPELHGEPPVNAVVVELQVGATNPSAGEAAQVSPRTIAVSGSLGAQILLWEVATAILGRIIGVDPFDQPDVESAKSAARALMAGEAVAPGAHAGGTGTASDVEAVAEGLRAQLPPDGYLAVQAYLDAAGGQPLAGLRAQLAQTLGVPVAIGFGPSYLHSTGQFHKGGPALGVFLQVFDPATGPGDEVSGVDFGRIIDAQARGDRQVLEAQGRPVFAIGATQIPALIAALA